MFSWCISSTAQRKCLKALTQGFKCETKKPSQPRQFWSSGASVSVMALSLLLLVLFAGLLLCLLFIIRLYIVVKNGSTRVSGNKAPVTVLAVVGSGNANYLRSLRASPGFIQGCFVSWIPSRSMSLKLDFGRNVQRLAHVCVSFTGARSWRCFATCQGTCCCQLFNHARNSWWRSRWLSLRWTHNGDHTADGVPVRGLHPSTLCDRRHWPDGWGQSLHVWGI